MGDPGSKAGLLPGKRPDLVVHGDHPLNAETPPRLFRESFVTPSDAFYVRCHGDVPQVNPGSYRLKVSGLVGRPLRLSLEEIRGSRRPRRPPPSTARATAAPSLHG
ncbi:MAG TPA: hypothetical protein VKA73_14720 [Rubrobacter sp.]|nr:hypothetical protein [Rubrobacter sp.]